MLAAVVVLVPVMAVVGSGVTQRLSVGGFEVPSAESSRVADILEDEFGTGTYTFALILMPKDKWVYHELNRPEGVRITNAIEAEPGVLEVASFFTTPEPPMPALSPLRDLTGHRALVGVKLAGTENEQRATAARLHETYVRDNETFDIFATGAVEISRIAAERADTDLRWAEILAAPFTLLGLLLIFKGMRAAIMPLAVAVVAVLGSFVALSLASSVIEISVFARTLVTALGLGLAIDYSLLLVARFRDERARGLTTNQAVEVMLATAGKTVVFSAATVGSSLLALLVFPAVYLRSFAYGGLAIVLTAMVASLLVIPPLLVRFGDDIGETAHVGESFWGRQAGRVIRHPWAWLALGVGILVMLGLPFLRFQAGRIDERVLPPEEPARIAAEDIRAKLGWREVNPIQIIAPDVDPTDTETVREFSEWLLRRDVNIRRVDSSIGHLVSHPDTEYHLLENESPIAGHFSPLPDAQQPGTWFNVVHSFDLDDRDVDKVIERLRDANTPYGRILVGGNNATVLDTVESVVARIPVALGTIALVTFVLLFVMTGSFVIPLKAIVLNLLSLTATFGALVWVFQDGHFTDALRFTPADHLDVFTPILMFCIAFGLSMDYEVFVLARIREEYLRTGDNDTAIRSGLGHTGRIVTAAAALLAVVFIAIATSGVSLVKMFGFGLALAVLADAFIVRATLTPAIMKLAGPYNWWAPRALVAGTDALRGLLSDHRPRSDPTPERAATPGAAAGGGG